jgi:hypothetical protein
VRDWDAKKRNFEVIVGKSTLAFKRGTRLTRDTLPPQ